MSTLKIKRENLLSLVEYRLISRNRYAEIPMEVPHKDFLDLVVVYSVTVKDDLEGTASLIVNNWMLEYGDITPEELETNTRRNTEKTGFEVMKVSEVLRELTDMEIEDPDDSISLYVITNHNKIYGANAMLFTEPFEKLAEELDSDLYILPSSVHEVLAVRKYATVEELRDMVTSINATILKPDEVLSDNVYIYDRKAKEIRIA